MTKVPAPTVLFIEPLTSPPRVHRVSTLDELLEVANTRKRIVEARGVSARTYDTRKRCPGTCSIGELQLLARVLQVSEEELFAVARTEAATAVK